MMPVIGSGTTLTSAQARDISVENGAYADYVPTSAVVGGNTSENLPNNVALVATHRTGLVGRSFRGRTYVGGFTESQSLGNVVNPSSFTAIQSAWNGFVTDMMATIGTWVVISRFHNGAPRTTGVSQTIISSDFRDSVWDTQRRRQK
jgi:hypothetical protein